MVLINGRAKVKLFDVHALCRFDVRKASFFVIALANSKQASRRCTCVHSSTSHKIVSMRIVVLTYVLYTHFFSIGSNRGCLTRFARSPI